MAMTGGSQLSYVELSDIAGQLARSAQQMESILNDVKSQFNKVGSDDVWSGTAAAATKERFDTLSAKFPEFSKAVEECHAYLLTVVQNFQEADRAIRGVGQGDRIN